MASFGDILKYFFLPPLLITDAIAKRGAFKERDNNSSAPASSASTASNTSEKAKNIYNYYSTQSEDGNTLFNSQQKTKRTLFGSNQTV